MNQDVIARREHFIKQMADNSVAIFFSAPEQTRSNDTNYPYRQNSDFWYLSQFTEPESVFVLVKESSSEHQIVLFNRTKDPLAETWTGYRLGQEAAIDVLNIDKAYPFSDISSVLPNIFNNKSIIYHASLQYDYADIIVNNSLEHLRSHVRMGFKVPTTVIDWRPIVHEMRLFKSEYEISFMRKAGEISAQGHLKAMQVCKPHLYEYQLEAEILREFAFNGARNPSYNTIVGGGNNGCILHYENNDKRLEDGQLVLIDAGCEYQYYAGDITRTFPVNGQFSPAQREIYDLVLKSQIYAISALKPGAFVKTVNEQVIKIMVEGLVKLNILTGDVDQLIEQKAHQAFYMHGLGHWLGIDVHDVGDDTPKGRDRALEPGMVLTVEPGLYINQSADVPVQYKGIGVRIEDNLLITADGNEILTKDVPKDPNEIEKLMSKHH